MLKKFTLLAATLALGTALTAPAQASSPAPETHHAAAHQTPGRSAAIWQQIVQLDRDVDRAEARKTISHREANGLHRDVAALKQQYRRYNANGLSPAEAKSLERGIVGVRRDLQGERHDNNGRDSDHRNDDHRGH